MEKSSTGLEANVAGLLCYVLGWVSGLVFVLIEKNSKFVRFHAWQSLITFLAIAIISVVLSWIPVFGWLLGAVLWLAAVIIWIMMMVKAYQGEMFKLPIAGNIAESQAK